VPTGDAALPGYAPGERRLPPTSNFVAPSAASVNGAIAAPVNAPAPAPVVLAQTSAASLSTLKSAEAPLYEPTPFATTQSEPVNTEPPQTESPFAEPAPLVTPDPFALPNRYESLATSIPREGYWPGQSGAASASQSSAPPVDLFTPTTDAPSVAPDMPAPTTPSVNLTQTMPITDPLGFDAPADPYAALEAHSEPPPARPNTNKSGGNPLAPLGRRRTTSMPDDTSPASV
jgi:hypothetical protein